MFLEFSVGRRNGDFLQQAPDVTAGLFAGSRGFPREDREFSTTGKVSLGVDLIMPAIPVGRLVRRAFATCFLLLG